MPAVIDHDQRRREVAEIAAGLVAEGGAEAATVRAVAQAAGYSTKVVSHFFADKRALLLATYRYAADRSSGRAEASQTAGSPDAAVYIRSLLPTSAAIRQDWLVWFAFWGFATTDAEFAEEQRQRVRQSRVRIVELMTADPRFSGTPEAERASAARDILTVVIGVALQAVFDPEEWPEERQLGLVEDRLRGVMLQTTSAS